MRPLRLLLTLCFAGLTILFTLVSFLGSHPEHRETSSSGERRGGFRSLFSFYSPTTLFPPAAVISLTDDNSTFFLARPAVFGPSLPSEGLCGQLWIGSGFGDDNFIRTSATTKAEGELGCSDIPGWVEGQGVWFEDHELGYIPGMDEQAFSSPDTSSQPKDKIDFSSSSSEKMPTDDGTDEYLHYPLRGFSLAGPRTGQLHADKNGKISEHADIQSLQESAEIAGKVVLLSRGGCGFLEKVKWAQRRGGVAVIVGDNVRGGPLINMWTHGDTSNVTIPSLFTSHTTAHLLSSLVPPGLRSQANETNSIEHSKTKENAKNSGTKGVSGKATTTAAKALPTPNVTADEDEQEIPKEGWTKSLLSKVGIGGADEEGADSSLNKKHKDWVVSDDWEDEPKPKEKKKTKAPSSSGTKSKDSFVIGVHDWRDPDLVGADLGKTTTLKTKTQTSTAQSTATKAAKAKTGSKKNPTSDLPGGSITPGSGEYDEAKDQQSKGWFKSLFASSPSKAEKRTVERRSKDNTDAKYNKDIGFDNDVLGAPNGHKGLWVTMTPTTVSISPFFDTLLVLVVSPLVTLTVVYAMLIIRSRIRRRRWRAPKSLVERLPVRTYQTMSCSSSATSTLSDTPNSPLLASSTLSRATPRSRTESGMGQAVTGAFTAKSGEKTPLLKKKYTGRQIECVVCLEEYVDGESRVMSLPCGHEFHAECITPWLTTRRRTCPICKGDVVRSMRGEESESSSSVATPIHPYSHHAASDVQSQAAQTGNDSPSAAIPIPRGLDDDDADVERGEDLAATLVNDQASVRGGGWRAAVSRSLSAFGGEAAWARAQEDRSR